MTTDYLGAADDMNAVIYNAIRGPVAALLGAEPPVYWQGVGKDNRPEQATYWVNVLRNTLGSDQGTLSNCVGVVGGRRFASWGMVVVELHGPTTIDNSFAVLSQCAMLIRTALRRKPTGNVVRFNNATIDDSIGVVDRYNRLNVVAGFEYDELQ